MHVQIEQFGDLCLQLRTIFQILLPQLPLQPFRKFMLEFAFEISENFVDFQFWAAFFI